MILQGTSYGKTLFFWAGRDEITFTMRGPAGTHDWVETFDLEEAQRFCLGAMVAITELLRQRDVARRQPAPAAVSAP